MFGTSPLELMADSATRANTIFTENFTYSLQWPVLAPGARITQILTIPTNSDFVWQDTEFAPWISNDMGGQGLDIAPDIEIEMLLIGSERQLYDKPQHVMNVANTFWGIATDFQAGAGTTSQSYHLPFPRLLTSNNQLAVTLVNKTSAREYLRIFLSLRGFKIFYITAVRNDVFRLPW